MRLSTLALCLLLATRALAEDEPLQLTLELAPADPRPGERIYWLGRLTNRSDHDLQLPSTLRTGAAFMAAHEPPDENHGFGVASGALPGRPPPFEWVPLSSGHSWEWSGEVGESLEACRWGCAEGTLYAGLLVSSSLAPRKDGARLIPATLGATANVVIAAARPSVLVRQGDGAVTARVLGAQQVADAVRVKFELVNATAQPLWLPKPEALQVGCILELPGVESGGRGSSPDAPPWGPKTGALVRPGQAVAGEVTCGGRELRKGAKIRLSLRPRAEFEPDASMSTPFVWAGRAEAPEFTVK